MCEAEIEKTRSANEECDSREVGLKRKREELKTACAETKQSLKSARAQEKEAHSSRDALYKQFSKGGNAVKEELANVKEVARASAEEQEKAFAAVQALKEEEYDANQVVVAYELKRKPKQEDESNM